MPQSRADAIGIRSDAHGLKPGQLHSKVYGPGERASRALVALGGCWALAGVTLFIPIAHFFLVPLFAIAGPVVAFNRYRAEVAAERVTGTCPECGQSITIELEPSDKLPKWSHCPECGKSVQLVYDTPSQ